MDKRLLLTIQSECNALNIALPWAEIGQAMGEHISGGAVIQHLAKLRIRMVQQGLAVPPPLKRGGLSRISTGPSLPRRQASAPNRNLSGARGTTAKKSGNIATKRRGPSNEASEESDEDVFDPDSDAEHGKPAAKRAKTAGKKRPSPKMKAEDDDWEDDKEGTVDVVVKREEDDGDRVVAAGAPFLALEKNVPAKGEVSKKAKIKPSLVVSLPTRNNGLPPIKKETPEQHDDSEESSDEESEDEEASEEDAARTPTAMPGNCEGNTNADSDSSKSTHTPQFNTPDLNVPPPRTFTVGSPTYSPFSLFSPEANNSVQPTFGGLPSIHSTFGDVNLSSNFNNSVSMADIEGNAGPAYYSTTMLDNGRDFGFDSSLSILDENSIEDRGMSTHQPQHSNFGFHNSSHGAQFSSNAQSPGSSLPRLSTVFHHTNMAQERATRESNSRSTLDPTPTSENADHTFGGVPSRRGSLAEITDRHWSGLDFDDGFHSSFPYNDFSYQPSYED